MPCRVDVCNRCHEYNCRCGQTDYEKWRSFDFEGALCDLLSLVETRNEDLLPHVDPKTLQWWKEHEEKETERIKAEALAKLTPRERRALGHK